MGTDMMDMDQLAAYLHRDVRRGRQAGQPRPPARTQGRRRVALRAGRDQSLDRDAAARLQRQPADSPLEEARRLVPLLITDLLPEASVARAAAGVDKVVGAAELVALAEQSWQVYDPDGGAGGDPRPRRNGQHGPAQRRGHPAPAPAAAGRAGRIGDGLRPHRVARSRSAAERGGLTDIFFLVCCRDDATHLRVLARLTRLLHAAGLPRRVARGRNSGGDTGAD